MNLGINIESVHTYIHICSYKQKKSILRSNYMYIGGATLRIVSRNLRHILILWLHSHVMPCHATLCYAMIFHAMLCHAMSCLLSLNMHCTFKDFCLGLYLSYNGLYFILKNRYFIV